MTFLVGTMLSELTLAAGLLAVLILCSVERS